MTARPISKYSAGLGRVAKISARLRASGVFDPGEYSKLIPGLNGNPLKAHVHVIRHGVRNSAFLSRDPCFGLVDPRDYRRPHVSPAEARGLRKTIQSAGDAELSPDYICTRNYLTANFKACLDVLAQTSPDYQLKFCHLMLRGPYHLAEVMPFMDALHVHYAGRIWERKS